MPSDFRDLLDRLRAADQLHDVRVPTDIRYLSTLIDQSDKAILFHDVPGYGMPVVSGLLGSRERLGIAAGCPYTEIHERLQTGIASPLEPITVPWEETREMFQEGESVDLYELPVPLCSELDGGPVITAGVTLAQDAEAGLNFGGYRYLVRESNLTGIDIVTPNNLRRMAETAFAAKRPLAIAICIGTHPIEIIASTYRAPFGTNELTIAGGMRGEPIRLAPCQTIDVPCLADAEIVLEAEILPTGWTQPEGRFGEFTGLMGALHWNPHVRVKAVTIRKGETPIYYALHMPWENIWPGAPIREAALHRVLRDANIQVTAINVTPGASCYFHVAIAIRKQPGDGKNAILAALTAGDIKHVVVVDDDIDVFDPLEVEWAVATRVQADRDLVVVSGARAKPLDPSIAPTPGHIPTTAKMGIDATIPDDVPRSRFDRISYPFAGEARLADVLGNAPGLSAAATTESAADVLAPKIRAAIQAEPLYFAGLVERFSGHDFKSVARALGALHRAGAIWQDEDGRICLADWPSAARLPTAKAD